MKCFHVKRKLSAYIDDELNQDERMLVKSHLERCSFCQHALQELTASWDLLETLPSAEPIAHAYTRVRVRIASRRVEEALSWLERLLIPAASVAALVLGVWVGSYVGKNGAAVAQTSVEEQVASSLYLDMLDDFPSASLSEAYITLAVED